MKINRNNVQQMKLDQNSNIKNPDRNDPNRSFDDEGGDEGDTDKPITIFDFVD